MLVKLFMETRCLGIGTLQMHLFWRFFVEGLLFFSFWNSDVLIKLFLAFDYEQGVVFFNNV